MSKSYKNYKPKQPLNFQIPESGPWDITKLDNLHFSWDRLLSYNKT